mgnify:CR=1 FL=1
MIIGNVAKLMNRLAKGQAIVIEIEDVRDSARAYMDSGFDYVRKDYIDNVIREVNSDEYPEFSLRERPDGRFTLDRR